MANIVRGEPRGISRFDPFRDLEEFFETRPLRSLFRDLPREPEIRMDVKEDETCYRVKAEIPGVKKDDIHVSIGGNDITISAETKREKEEKKDETFVCSERYYGKQVRNFTLRHEVDSAKAEAKYQDGVLELTLPKQVVTPVKEVPVK